MKLSLLFNLVVLSLLSASLTGCSEDLSCWPICSSSSSSGVDSSTTDTTTDTTTTTTTDTTMSRSVTVVSPNGHENLKTEQYHVFTWTMDGVDSVNVDLFRAGNFVLNIRTADTDTSARWYISDEVIASNNKYQIKVPSTADPLIRDYSDEFFTIRH